MNSKLYKLMNWPAIEEIIYSEADNPHEILGPHVVGNNTLVQAYFPGATRVLLQKLNDMSEKEMEIADEDGFFAVLLTGKKVDAYRYVVTSADGNVVFHQDAYRHETQITAKDEELFQQGIHYTIYEKLGAHPMTLLGEEGVYFAVWAPNALRVSAVGDFNDWDGRLHQMRKLPSGIFEIFVPGAKLGDNYKFELKLKGGLTYLKADPYAGAAQLRPETASVICDISKYEWKDEAWLSKRAKNKKESAPMSVYELYLGSFLAPKEGCEYANYRDIAKELVTYVTEMGYTHVELMPIMEHPLDASWGYQVIGYYAPTARYGTPEDFMYLVDTLHQAGIGVILDWVPAHFPRDSYGLSNFDGTCLYEHLDPRKGYHPHWGTLIYNYGRAQVKNYLIANALYWVEKFHADGIRMDAVASMLYLDYGKNEGEWIPNIYGTNENIEAIEFVKHLNSIMKKRNPGVLMIAEESTAWPMITGDFEDGGLGFDLKWNMGWMNDYLRYIQNDPYFRSHHHNELTFSMIYAYSERFILVLSHDEVVHGKSSLIGKMPGAVADKFSSLKATYAFMMTHPGKKLLFMGQDIAEFNEWQETRIVEWDLLKYPEHKGVSDLVKKLNNLYCTLPALYELDDKAEGFEWINSISANDCYVTFLRKGKKKDDMILVVANFAGILQEIQTGVPYMGKFKEILNTDAEIYGGTGVVNRVAKKAVNKEWDGLDYSIKVKLAPSSVSIFSYQPIEEPKKETAKKTTKKAVKKPVTRKKEA